MRVIVFDLDDTLYFERDFARSGFRAADRWFQETIGVSGLGARCWQLFQDGRRHQIFDAALADLDIANHQDWVERLVEIYRTHAPEISLAPDAERYLERAGAQVSTAVITDGLIQTQMSKIRALEVERRVDWIVCTDQWGRDFWKPHARAFASVESASGARATQLVYVADNPAKDFVTPRARGWWTVQIVRPERVNSYLSPSPMHSAHAEVFSLDMLDACLARLE